MDEHTQKISATEPDWSREAVQTGVYEPWKRLIRTIRRYQEATGFFGHLLRPVIVLRHRFWSVICSADIPIDTSIGGGIIMLHPQGVIIHPEAEIGPNCLIFQQVTLGMGSVPGLPKIGGHVDIGAGAKILGGVRIGNHAKIGANAVVISNVPAHATAVGIPARIIEQRDRGKK